MSFSPLRIAVFSCSVLMSAALLVQAAQAQAVAVSEKPYTALRPGLWEIRTATRMVGMPYELPPVPYTTTQCLTQELLNNQENLASVTATRGKCDIHNVVVTDESTTWNMTCHQNGMDIDANGSIAPITNEAYTGNVHFVMHNANVQGLKGVVNVQGMRQSDCLGQEGENAALPTYRTPVYTPR